MEPMVAFSVLVVMYGGVITVLDEWSTWRKSRMRRAVRVSAVRSRQSCWARGTVFCPKDGVAGRWQVPARGSV